MPDLITHLRRLLESGSCFHECRRCGTAVDGRGATCPSCGSHEIARYEV